MLCTFRTPRSQGRIRLATLAVLGMTTLAGMGGLVGAAAASGPPPRTRMVAFHPDNPDLVALYVTTIGLFFSNDGGASFRLLCRTQTAILPTDEPVLRYTQDGNLLLSSFVGLQRGAPDGCSWSFPEAELSDYVGVRDLIGDPSDPTGHYVVTSPGEGASGIFHSSDDGQSWERMRAFPEGTYLQRLRISTQDPQHMAMMVAEFDTGTMRSTQMLYRTSDAGEHWTTHEVPLEEGETRFTLLHMSHHDPLRLLAIARRPDTGVDANPTRVLLTLDGGEQWSEVLALGGYGGITANPNGDEIWIGDPTRGLYRSDDDGATFELVHEGLHVSCLNYHGDRLWACVDNWVHCYALGYSTDRGESFVPQFGLQDTAGVVQCEQFEDTSNVCEFELNYIDWHVDASRNLGVCETPCDPDDATCGNDAGVGGSSGSDAGTAGTGGAAGTAGGPSSPDAGDATNAPAKKKRGCGVLGTSRAHAKGQVLILLVLGAGVAMRRRPRRKY